MILHSSWPTRGWPWVFLMGQSWGKLPINGCFNGKITGKTVYKPLEYSWILTSFCAELSQKFLRLIKDVLLSHCLVNEWRGRVALHSPLVRTWLAIWQADLSRFLSTKAWLKKIKAQTYSYGHLLVITGYKWDYTFYKWGYKYIKLVKGHNCTNLQQFLVQMFLPAVALRFRCLLLHPVFFCAILR